MKVTDIKKATVLFAKLESIRKKIKVIERSDLSTLLNVVVYPDRDQEIEIQIPCRTLLISLQGVRDEVMNKLVALGLELD